MKMGVVHFVSVAAVAAGVVAVAGCCKKPDSAGVGEQTGAAVDRAAEKTVEMATNVAEKASAAAKTTATAAKNVTGQAIEKTGAALEKTGAALEETGAGMQD